MAAAAILNLLPVAILNILPTFQFPVSVKSVVPQYPDLINMHRSSSEPNLMLLKAQLFCYSAPPLLVPAKGR